MTEVNKPSGQLSVILIMAIPVCIVLLSTFVYYTGIGAPDGTKNQGMLVDPPRLLANFDIDYVSPPNNGKATFTLVQTVAQCDQSCADDLYYSRQLKTALGKRSLGLRRLLWVDDPVAFSDELRQQHPNLTVAVKPNNVQLAQMNQDLDLYRYGLVDAQGYFLMVYTDQHDYKQISKDLKFLLTQAGY